MMHCGCAGIHAVEVLVLPRHVDRAGGAAGRRLRRALRPARVLSRLVLCAVSARL